MAIYYTITIGMRFGRLVIVSRSSRTNKYRAAWWNCRCDCGTEKTIAAGSLRRGAIVSCGCFRKERLLAAITTHGGTRNGRSSPEYRVWKGIFARCYQPKASGFDHYGGRGITVCDRWRNFENFLSDMGPRPAGHEIDRIDSTGNYEPENCRWATRKQQVRNTSQNRFLTFRGHTQCVTDWAAELGMPKTTLLARLKYGWTIEDALTRPIEFHRPRSERLAECVRSIEAVRRLR